MNFDHLQRSLEGSRLISCTFVIMLVVMVACSHLSYLNFFIYLYSSEAYSSCFGLGCACWEGDSRCREPPKGPQILAVGWNIFDPWIVGFTWILIILNTHWRVQGLILATVLLCWWQGCLCARPPRPVDLRAYLTKKYSSIFEHIWVIFKEYSENMSSMPGLCLM
jgi:hypothetical protein